MEEYKKNVQRERKHEKQNWKFVTNSENNTIYKTSNWSFKK